ncbi:MAG: N-acetylmuramoyl-L-alanine amidase [Verrucomicrobiota bacterium]
MLLTTSYVQPGFAAEQLTSLATRPNWSELDSFQGRITREVFLERLDRLYAPNGAWRETLSIGDDHVLITTSEGAEPYRLAFATSADEAESPARTWRTVDELIAISTPEKPLKGWRIALDPGHLGGKYGPMEGRSWQIGDGPRVQEGDLVLEVAMRLKPQLEALGAEVFLVRESDQPLTQLRPDELLEVAEERLRKRAGADTPPPSVDEIRRTAELLFYRVAEIHARADAINAWQPDFVLCLHYNATDFPDYANPTLVEGNHLHVLVNGAYSRGELAYDDIRLGMLLKLLSGTDRTEIALAAALAEGLAASTALPPFTYQGSNAIGVDDEPYVWGRNLLANRLYACPAIFLEPYVLNSKEVYPAILQALNDPESDNITLYKKYTHGVIRGLQGLVKQH